MDWAGFPVWEFCRYGLESGSVRYAVKITASVEIPYVEEKMRDGPLTIRTLINSARKLVGYSFVFKDRPSISEFGYSLAASYGVMETNSAVIVLGSPHVRVLRAGTEEVPSYHVVLRHK